MVVNVKNKFDDIDAYWSPKVIGELNGQYIKIAKLKGEFVWHDHKHEDELFYIVKGQLTIRYRDREVRLAEGEFHIVPRGTSHFPVASEECWVMLFEPKSTLHTGDVETDQTKSIDDQLA